MSYPRKRNLDGIYHRVERGGEWLNLCWTDLTDEERERVSKGRPETWWRDMALYMTKITREIGDQLGIVRSGE